MPEKPTAYCLFRGEQKRMWARFLVTTIALATALCAQTIPHTEAETLAGKKIVLPDAFSGRPALIIIGFSRAGGDSAGRWGKELKKDLAEKIRIYSVAVLQDAPKLMRGMIKHGMRSGTPKTEQDSFVVLEHDEDTWKKLAGFSDADAAYLLLIDSHSNIRWRGQGKFPDPQTLGQLKSETEKLLAAMASEQTHQDITSHSKLRAGS